MPSQHKHNPIPVRLPEADRAWLLEHAEETDRAVNAVVVEAIQALRKRREDDGELFR